MRVKTGGVDKIYEKAVEIFLEEYRRNIKSKGVFTVAFSGGTTPLKFFRSLKEVEVDWTKILVFQVDERQVPIEHPDSNGRVLKKELLEHTTIPGKNVFLMDYNEDLEKMVEGYSEKLLGIFNKGEASFDLIFLGLGSDGHTASLFPDNVDLSGDVVAYVNKKGGSVEHCRVSLGIEAINRSKKKVFMFKSQGKEIVMDEVMHGKHPASHVKGDVKYLSD